MIEPSLPRLTTDDERNQIKTRTQQLIRLAGGPEFFAPVTGVKKAQLSKYGSLSEPDHFIHADVIVELDRQIGAPMMVSMLAAMLGYRLVPIEEGEPDELTTADLADVATETSDVVRSLSTAMRNGPMGSAARREVRREIAEAKRSLFLVDRKLARGAA